MALEQGDSSRQSTAEPPFESTLSPSTATSCQLSSNVPDSRSKQDTFPISRDNDDGMKPKLKEVTNTDSVWHLIVFGFVHRFQKNQSIAIPEMILYLITAYYKINERLMYCSYMHDKERGRERNPLSEDFEDEDWAKYLEISRNGQEVFNQIDYGDFLIPLKGICIAGPCSERENIAEYRWKLEYWIDSTNDVGVQIIVGLKEHSGEALLQFYCDITGEAHLNLLGSAKNVLDLSKHADGERPQYSYNGNYHRLPVNLNIPGSNEIEMVLNVESQTVAFSVNGGPRLGPVEIKRYEWKKQCCHLEASVLPGQILKVKQFSIAQGNVNKLKE